MTNYIPNVGFVVGLIPPAILGLLVGGPELMIAVIVVYCVLNFIIQSVLQPKFVGDAVGLTTTVSFLSLIVWAYILGPIGAILAIPASLFFKALLVDMDPPPNGSTCSSGTSRCSRRGRPRSRGVTTPIPMTPTHPTTGQAEFDARAQRRVGIIRAPSSCRPRPAGCVRNLPNGLRMNGDRVDTGRPRVGALP